MDNWIDAKYLEVTASRFPWQEGYGWFRSDIPKAPLNSKGSKFGGGWDFKFGISIALGDGYQTWLVNLLIGTLRIRVKRR